MAVGVHRELGHRVRAVRGRGRSRAKQAEQQVAANAPVLTPQQAADQILAKVGKTTLVSVQDNVMIAGEPSYQLVLAPKDHRSLVGRVVIAVDGKYGVPLRVQLYAKGASSPAFQVGYTALQFVAPDAANFAFTPPHGAKVDVVKPGDGKLGMPGAAAGHAGHERLRHVRQELAHRGVVPAGGPDEGARPGRGGGPGLGQAAGHLLGERQRGRRLLAGAAERAARRRPSR